MKIGLVATYNNNYGSLLQVYATQKVLKQIGYDSEIISYRKRNPFTQFLRLFNFPLLKMKIKDSGKFLITKLRYKEIYNSLNLRNQKFQEFRENYLTFSKKISNDKELKCLFNNGEYFSCLLGSDQLWNPINYGTHFFTLEKIPQETFKITYAPSFGVKKIPWYQKRGTKKYLKRIQKISVREEQGQKIVKKLINKDVPVVCDPTLLIDKSEWDKLKGEQSVVGEKYVFCYFLGKEKAHRELAKKYATEKGLKIVALQHLDEFVKSDVGFADYSLYDVAPPQFINLIANAEFVFTDSFHGSIFSILYKKRFITLPRFTVKNTSGTNSRLQNLFKKLGLKHKWNPLPENVDSALNSDIRSDVYQRIDELRGSSMEYLKDSLRQAIEYYENNK